MQQYDFIKHDTILGFRPVMKDGNWGLIDKNNEGIILCILDEEPKFFGGFILCKHEGKYGLLNAEGEYVVPMECDYMRKDAAYIVAFKGGKTGIIDYSGKVLVEPVYDDISCRKDGFFVKREELLGYVDSEGDVVIPPQYDNIIILDDNYAIVFGTVFKHSKRAIYDMKKKHQICTTKYDVIELPSCGLFKVGIGDKYGYIDETGKEVVHCIYKDASNFLNGYATVFDGEHYAYINTEGKKVTRFIYDRANPVNKSLMAEVVYKGAPGTVVLEGRH